MTIDVPAYTVEEFDGVNLIAFEGAGQDLLLGYPITPKYPLRYTVPDGMFVSDVRLTAQAYPETIPNLDLKIGAEEYDCNMPAQPAAQLAPQGELEEWPENYFDWEVETSADGQSELVITLHPLRYFPLQAEGQFTNQFTFDVELVDMGAQILSVKPQYEWFFVDEAITSTLWISATAVPQDLLLSAAIVNLADGKVLAGLPTQTLDDVSGLADVQLVGDSTGLGNGQYTLQVELRNLQGDVMNRAFAPFDIGVALATVDQLDVPLAPFEPGDSVPIGIHFQNIGTVDLEGTIIVSIQSLQGGDPVELSQTFSGIAPWGTVQANLNWDTTGVSPGDFVVSAYALYNSQSTEILTANISSYRYIYLPTVRR